MQTLNIQNINNDFTLKQSNSKDNIFKAYEKKKPKERLNEDQLVQIFGKKYEDLNKKLELYVQKKDYQNAHITQIDIANLTKKEKEKFEKEKIKI